MAKKKMPAGLQEYHHYQSWLKEHGYSTNGKLATIKRRALGHGAPEWSGTSSRRRSKSRTSGKGTDTMLPFYGTIPGW